MVTPSASAISNCLHRCLLGGRAFSLEKSGGLVNMWQYPINLPYRWPSLAYASGFFDQHYHQCVRLNCLSNLQHQVHQVWEWEWLPELADKIYALCHPFGAIEDYVVHIIHYLGTPRFGIGVGNLWRFWVQCTIEDTNTCNIGVKQQVFKATATLKSTMICQDHVIEVSYSLILSTMITLQLLFLVVFFAEEIFLHR